MAKTWFQKLEQAALDHAAAELRYQRSTQARIDLAADITRRNKLTIAQGHSPKCGLLRCHPDCKKGNAK
jgi:hypothetical protein